MEWYGLPATGMHIFWKKYSSTKKNVNQNWFIGQIIDIYGKKSEKNKKKVSLSGLTAWVYAKITMISG